MNVNERTKFGLKLRAKQLATIPPYLRSEEAKARQRRHKVFGTDAGGNVKQRPLFQKLSAREEYLHSLRKGKIRREARALHLARAFIDGMPITAVEGKNVFLPALNAALDIVKKETKLEEKLFWTWAGV